MSSKENLAREELKLLGSLEEFVNTGDSSAEWSRLKKHWPDLLPAEVYDLPFDRVQELNQQLVTANASDPPADWGPLGKGMSYSPQRDGIVRVTLPPLELRSQLRRLWRDPQSANEILPVCFTVKHRPLPSGVGLTAQAESVRWELYRYAGKGKDYGELRTLMRSFALKVDWACGRLVPEFETKFQRACYVLLKNSARAKFCQGPDCLAPYFIAHRATQKYCSPDCLKPIQKKWKLDWWNQTGSKRRKMTATSRKTRTKNRAKYSDKGGKHGKG
jgi:hypothetical protein